MRSSLERVSLSHTSSSSSTPASGDSTCGIRGIRRDKEERKLKKEGQFKKLERRAVGNLKRLGGLEKQVEEGMRKGS